MQGNLEYDRARIVVAECVHVYNLTSILGDGSRLCLCQGLGLWGRKLFKTLSEKEKM